MQFRRKSLRIWIVYNYFAILVSFELTFVVVVVATIIYFSRWYLESRLDEFGLSKRDLLLAYFLASGSIFEPERSHERLAWAKTTALVETIKSYVRNEDLRKDFAKKFNDYIDVRDYSIAR